MLIPVSQHPVNRTKFRIPEVIAFTGSPYQIYRASGSEVYLGGDFNLSGTRPKLAISFHPRLWCVGQPIVCIFLIPLQNLIPYLTLSTVGASTCRLKPAPSHQSPLRRSGRSPVGPGASLSAKQSGRNTPRKTVETKIHKPPGQGLRPTGRLFLISKCVLC